jgi:hypothetical protein
MLQGVSYELLIFLFNQQSQISSAVEVTLKEMTTNYISVPVEKVISLEDFLLTLLRLSTQRAVSRMLAETAPPRLSESAN